MLSRLLQIVDTNDANSGTLLADEIFTPDAEFIAANGRFTGKDGTFTSVHISALLLLRSIPVSILVWSKEENYDIGDMLINY